MHAATTSEVLILADLEKTVKIIFGSDDKQLKKSAADIEAEFKKIDKAITNMTDPLANAGAAILKVNTALAALVVGGIALAIKESSAFNKEFALISTSVSATGDDLAKYRDQILDYSTTSTKSISDINAALYTAAQAGIQWGNSLEFMGKAEQLAVANNANLNTTVDLLTGTMNAYGYEVKDVGHLNDVFFTSTLIGKQTIDELGQSMGMVVGIAANFGVSFEQLSAAISTLTAKGMETSEAITAVKGVITSIADPSKEAAEAAKQMGLDFSVAALKSEGLEAILQKVMAATGGDADKTKLLFGEVRALNGVLQLTGDGMTFFNDALQKIGNSTGSAEAAYKKMSATFDAQSQMLINSAKVLMVEVGTRMEEVAGKYAGAFATLIKAVAQGIDKGAFDGIFAVFDQFGTDLTNGLKKITATLPEALANIDLSKLIEAMRNAGKAMGELFGDTSADDITEAIQSIIDAVASLISITQGIIEVFAPIAAAVNEAIKAFNTLDASIKELMGNMMGLSMAYKFFGPISIALIALGADAESAGGIFTFFFASLENGFNVIKVLVYALATGFFELITAAVKFLDLIPGLDFSKEVSQNEKMLDSLKEKLSDATGDLMISTGKVVDAWNGTGESADKATEKVSNFDKAVQKIEEGKTTKLEVKTDPKNLEDEGKKIDGVIPKDKKIGVSLDTEKVKKDSELIKTMVEWKAKIDIADIEAQTKRLEAMFGSVNTGIESTGTLLASLFGQLNNASAWNADIIEDAIEREQTLRQTQFDLQKQLIEQQIKMNELRIQRMNEGDFSIKIDSTGLEPALEMVMWEIIKKVQIRAVESSAEFLLGIA